jgi:ubiquinone/menaquinone biosynthesis C-methylase UbiE
MDEHIRQVIAHHDAWADTYDSQVESMTLYNRITLDNICRFLPKDPDSLILDAGGGTGFWAVQLAQMGYHVMLTDLAGGMLAKAEEKTAELGFTGLVQTRMSDIRHMPEFADGQFDMIICQGDPLSYCGDYNAAVREFARVLRSGGAVVASVDNRVRDLSWIADSTDRGVISRLVETGDSLVSHADGEFRYTVHAFTPEELCDLFTSNGLSVERCIGKVTISRSLGLYRSDDPDVQEWLYQLELKHCGDPAFVSLGHHLEIACRKL